MLPLALGYLALLATAIWYLHAVLDWPYGRKFALALFGLNAVLFLVLGWGVDRGRIVSGSVAGRRA
jgi:hypothetical protein